MTCHEELTDGAAFWASCEIEAEISGGILDNVVRTITENRRPLTFGQAGFEES
jgi:hypothetical protein